MAKTQRTSRAATLFERLRSAHPDARCELDHRSPFELLVAVVLSAQATDVSVNKLTPSLFRRYLHARALAQADSADVEKAIQSIGMFRQKAKNLVGLSRTLVKEHGGQVPRTMPELLQLPGVGRKTANVVLGVAFGKPDGVVVDTHVLRVSQRLGLTQHVTADEVEGDLNRLFPPEQWDRLGHTLIFHGRRICTARCPACSACPVNDLCPSAFHAEQVGRKPPRASRATPSVAGRRTIRVKAAAPKAAGATKARSAAPKLALSARTRGASSAAVAARAAEARAGTGRRRPKA